MEYTLAGLPNSCSHCAKKCTTQTGWYAENVDAARAGAGLCAECAMPAKVLPPPMPPIPTPSVTTVTPTETNVLTAEIVIKPSATVRKAKKA